MTLTLTPISFLDGAAASKTVVSYNDGTNNVTAHVLLDGTGALMSPATAGNQTSGNTSLATIATNTTNASTSTLQTAGNTLLTSIQGLLSAALAVVANVTQVGGSALSLGQKAMAASLPVTIASDQASLPVAMTANTTGGTSTFCASGASGGNALLTATPVAVKTSAGNLYGFDFVNTGAATAFVQIFDAATGSVTLGTTAAKMAKWVPAGGSWEEKFSSEGKITFGTAITMAATTTAGGNTAPATGIIANVTFK